MLISQNRSVFLPTCNSLSFGVFLLSFSRNLKQKWNIWSTHTFYIGSRYHMHMWGHAHSFSTWVGTVKSRSFLKADRQSAESQVCNGTCQCFSLRTSEIQAAACLHLCHSLGVFMFPDEASGYWQLCFSVGRVWSCFVRLVTDSPCLNLCKGFHT